MAKDKRASTNPDLSSIDLNDASEMGDKARAKMQDVKKNGKNKKAM